MVKGDDRWKLALALDVRQALQPHRSGDTTNSNTFLFHYTGVNVLGFLANRPCSNDFCFSATLDCQESSIQTREPVVKELDRVTSRNRAKDKIVHWSKTFFHGLQVRVYHNRLKYNFSDRQRRQNRVWHKLNWLNIDLKLWVPALE